VKPLLLIILGAALAGGGFGVYRWLSAPSAAEYTPSASEVPLMVDFEPAAEKRVQPENYRKELTRIENELIQLSRSEER
jgi:hypothetical protein